MDLPNPTQADWAPVTDDDLLALLDYPTEVAAADSAHWVLASNDATADGVDDDHLLNGITGGFEMDGDEEVDIDPWVDPDEEKTPLPRHFLESLGSFIGDKHSSSVVGTISSSFKSLGACWRCKILRQKCDPYNPCGACPQVNTTTIWQDLGCKRGTLSERSPRIDLCPGTLREETIPGDSTEQQIFYLISSQITQQQRTREESLRLTLANPNYTLKKIQLEIYCPFIKTLIPGIEMSANEKMILRIIWGLMENPKVKAKVAIKSVESFAILLTGAANFDKDANENNLICLAFEALDHCFQLLSMSNNGLLSRFPHDTCHKGKCKLESLSKLVTTTDKYLEELSAVLLREETLHTDRKWWLTCLYSLYIQHFVRLGLMEIERLLIACSILPDTVDLQAKFHCQLAVRLFTAASAEYDPLSADWTLDEPPTTLLPDFKLVQYCWEARKILRELTSGFHAVNGSYSLLSVLFDLNTYIATNQKHQGKRRRENSPPKPTSQANASSSQDSNDIGRVSRGTDQYRDLSILPPLLPPPSMGDMTRRPLGNFPSLASRDRDEGHSFPWSRQRDETHSSMRRLSRNTSPASRTSVDLSRSPRGISGHASRNRSPDSLFGLPESISRWAGVANDSPASIYSMSPTGLSPKLPLSRRASGTVAMGRRSRLSDEVTGASVMAFRKSCYMCECCPKNPKKFESAEALGKHEAEKQYECSFCPQRFKNKNEAERHQNSLHVRRHSWSCSALSSYDRAFHDSTDGETDTCGFCGDSFPRSGLVTNAQARIVTDGDWEERVQHLQIVHKFRECNLSKKFYRADHFRQHLKHSHAATRGTWTNILENACMAEEEPLPQ